jgi:hypothetical protein
MMAAVATLTLAAACTKDNDKTKEPVDQGAGELSGAASATEPGASDLAKAPLAQPGVSDNCIALAKVDPDQPTYLPGKSVVLTRLLKTCVTHDGRKGIERDSPWLAMGFPCTAGGGKVDVKGHAYAPKMVSFVVSTDCPMAAASKEHVKKLFAEAVGLPAETKLMAVNPFAVTFWEIPGMPDADTGFAIELRSAPAIEGAWKRVRDKDKLRIRLYGRENAWVRGDHFYLVEADLHLAGNTQFALDVVSVKALSKEEIATVKTRCEALRTARNCGEIF